MKTDWLRQGSCIYYREHQRRHRSSSVSGETIRFAVLGHRLLAAPDFFGGFIGNTWEPLLWFALFMGVTAAIVLLGVQKGRIAPGYDADILVVDDALNVKECILSHCL